MVQIGRRREVLTAIMAGLLLFGGASVFAPPAATSAATTTVSLTFDDGQATQFQAASAMSSRGMAGTFYINSGLVGSSGYYMTWSQIQQLADAGHEIGGHTVNHVKLTQLSATDAQREICDDRATLQQRGYNPVSFAYPYAASNSSVEQLVQQCGYANARTVGNLYGPNCTGCAYAETIPPRNAYYLRTAEPVDNSTTLAQLQGYVTNAESHGGGWVPLVFHGVCATSCSSTGSVNLQTLTAFLDWLQPRSSSGTVVRTIGDAMGVTQPGSDVTPPATNISCNGATCADGWYATASVQVALTASDAGSGVASTAYTTDGTDPATSSTAVNYDGPFTLSQTTTVKFTSTDSAGNKEPTQTRVIRIDSAPPVVSVTAPVDSSSVARGAKVTVSASAADSGSAPSGIANVAFYLDGNALLGRDSAAPYQLVWNTRKASIGEHTLTAVATDVAGNRATSAVVKITVTR
jgi:peptidoglycan/xylan/chitin deacetylase (PgdA/CDA1 family)